MHIVFNNVSLDNQLFYIREYQKNEIIFSENESCEKIGFLEEGLITIKTDTYFDKEYEINKIYPNGIFGEFLLFSNDNKYLGTGIASRNCKVIYFTKPNLLQAFSNQIFLANYLQLISSISKSIQQKVKVLSQGSIKDKIMFLLYNNLKKTNNCQLLIRSKQHLADFLCVPRPSLSRELINLEKKGLLLFDRHSITLVKKPNAY